MKDCRKTTQMITSLIAGMTLSAAGATWTNGNWSVAANWAEGAVPADGEAVTINNPTAGATFNVDVGSVKISSLTFASGGKQCYVVGGTLNISAQAAVVANHSMTISNSLVLSHSAPKLRAATSGRSYYCGDITLTHATGDLYSFGKGGSTFYGTVTVPRDFRPGGGANWQSGSHHYFYGPLKCRHVLNASSYDDTTYHYESTSNSWTYFETGYYVRNAVATAGALPRTAVLRAFGSDNYSGGTCSLGGTDQTIDRLSGTTKLLTVNGGSSPMTLTLLATASDTSKAVLNGSLSLVYAPTDSSYVQTVNGGACSMNGSLTVSNGTFRVTGTSSLAKVKRIVVSDGARFELLTETANALAGVTNIVLGAGSHFAITNATTPFVDNAVSLEMTATSSFDLPDDADYLFAAAKVDGTPLDGGTYTGDGTVPQFKGSGSITIPDIEMPTVSATWDGGGADEGIGTDANWDGDATPALNAKSLYPLFATGGTQASVDRALDFKGLHFGGASASFSLVSNSPSASLTLRQSGIAVDASHTATIDVPVTIKNDQAWNVGSGGTLRFAKPVASAYDYSVSQIGHGRVRLDAPNGFRGAFNIGSETEAGGVLDVYAPTNALGPATDEPLTIWQSGNGAAGGAHGILRLRGTVIERPVTFKGTGNQYYTLDVYGTNTLTRPLNVYGHFRPRLNAGSNLVLAGGGRLNYSSQWLVPEGPGEITFGGGLCSISYLYVNFFGRFDFNAEVSCGTIEFAGGGQMHVNAEGALYTEVFKCNSARIIMDLHGHDIRCGRFDPMNAGIFTSDAPALIHLESQNTTITNRAVRFTGKAGLEMKGNGAVVITNAMESAGPVRVAGGRLRFTASGSWSNSADIGVSGTGRLIVSQPKTFAKNAVFSFADSGVLEIPAGVTLRASQMLVGGVPVKDGMYGSATSPASNKSQSAHFAGNGTLLVGKLGTILSLR